MGQTAIKNRYEVSIPLVLEIIGGPLKMISRLRATFFGQNETSKGPLGTRKIYPNAQEGCKGKTHLNKPYVEATMYQQLNTIS